MSRTAVLTRNTTRAHHEQPRNAHGLEGARRFRNRIFSCTTTTTHARGIVGIWPATLRRGDTRHRRRSTPYTLLTSHVLPALRLAHTFAHLWLALRLARSALIRPHARPRRHLAAAAAKRQQALRRAAHPQSLAALDRLRRRARSAHPLVGLSPPHRPCPGVVVALGLYERWSEWGYLLYCVACASLYLLVPLLFPSAADKARYPLCPARRRSQRAVRRARRWRGATW